MILVSKKNISIALASILGGIFLFSGIAKALDVSAFGSVLNAYSSKFFFLAPILISIEIFLGLSLLVAGSQKKILLFSLAFTIFLTTVFLYGYFVLGIKNCGCFGRLYYLSPKKSMLRNVIMIAINGYLLTQVSSQTNLNSIRKYVPIVFSIIMLGFLSFRIYKEYIPIKYIQGSSIANSFLAKYQQDSTKQYIFILKPSCGACWAKTRHINEILVKNPTLPIIGLYTDNSTEAYVTKYKNEAKPNFKIYPEPKDSLKVITHYFPAIITLKNKKIIAIEANLKL